MKPIRQVHMTDPPDVFTLVRDGVTSRRAIVGIVPAVFTLQLIQNGAAVFGDRVAADTACGEVNHSTGGLGIPSYPCFRGYFAEVVLSVEAYGRPRATLTDDIYIVAGHYHAEGDEAGEGAVRELATA